MMLYSLGDSHPTLLGGGHFVAPNAAVIGRVTLHENASVWFSCVLRGDVEDIEVGAGTNIQDDAVVHADPGFPARIGANEARNAGRFSSAGATTSSSAMPNTFSRDVRK